MGYRIFGQVINREIAEVRKGFRKRAALPPVPHEHYIVLSTFASHFPSVHGAGDIWS